MKTTNGNPFVAPIARPLSQVELSPEVVGGPGATRNPLVNPHDFHQKMAISGGLTNGFCIYPNFDGNPEIQT